MLSGKENSFPKSSRKDNPRTGACWPGVGQVPELIQPPGLQLAGRRPHACPRGRGQPCQATRSEHEALGCLHEAVWLLTCFHTWCRHILPLCSLEGWVGSRSASWVARRSVLRHHGDWDTHIPASPVEKGPRSSCPLSFLVGVAPAPGASSPPHRALPQRGSRRHMAFWCPEQLPAVPRAMPSCAAHVA